jgi:prepilin-type N-terminal cleavage/methylation domain-containing protein
MRRREESGFTLVELVIAIVLVAMLTGAVAAALGTSLRAADSTAQRSKESNDAQLISTFLVADAQATGGTDPATAAIDPTIGVSTTDPAGCTAAGTLRLRFSWKDRSAGAVQARVSTYWLDGTTLSRQVCDGGGAILSSAPLGHHVASADPACDPACADIPQAIRLTVTETPGPFEYTLEASVRPQAETPPDDGTGTKVPLLALGNGPCTEGATGVAVTGGANVTVHGDVLVNATGVGNCPAMLSSGSSRLAVDGDTHILAPGECDGNRCPSSVTSYTSPLTDPLAGLAAPPGDCDHTPKLTITADTHFDPGTYILCDGLEIAAQAKVTGTDVFFYLRGGSLVVHGQAQVDLSAPSSGAYENLLFWVATNAPVLIEGGSDVDTYDGILYAPLSTVTVKGGTNTGLGGIIARNIAFAGGGVSVLGPLAPSAPALAIAPSSLPAATVGTPYSASVSASGGTAPYTWDPPTGLPSWLSFDTGTQTFSGLPTAPGSWTVSVTVTDDDGATASRSYAIDATSSAPGAPTIVDPAGVTNWTIGVAYPQTTVTATGGTAPYSWSATGLPPGMAIDPAAGVIGGIPNATGAHDVVVTVQDATGATDTQPYTMVISAAPVISGPASLPSGTVGTPYPAVTATATGGTDPHRWEADLPPGLAIDEATGAITGTPTAAGTYTITLQYTDFSGTVVSRVYADVPILPSLPSFTQTSFSLKKNRTFDDLPFVSGGTMPRTLTGAPTWVTYDDATGTLDVTTPKDTGTYSFIMTISDAAGASQQATITFTVTNN